MVGSAAKYQTNGAFEAKSLVSKQETSSTRTVGTLHGEGYKNNLKVTNRCAPQITHQSKLLNPRVSRISVHISN